VTGSRVRCGRRQNHPGGFGFHMLQDGCQRRSADVRTSPFTIMRQAAAPPAIRAFDGLTDLRICFLVFLRARDQLVHQVRSSMVMLFN